MVLLLDKNIVYYYIVNKKTRFIKMNSRRSFDLITDGDAYQIITINKFKLNKSILR